MVGIISLSAVVLTIFALYFCAPTFLFDIAALVSSNNVDELANRLRSYGAWSFAASAVLGVIINIIGIPTIAFSGANGLVFGFFPATVICWSAEIIGAALVFVLARSLFYKQALRYIARHKKITNLHEYTA